MQQHDDKILKFNRAVGAIVKKIRKKTNKSINKFALEYDIDRGNFSRLEKGAINCRLFTAWKISEASEIKFSDFAKLLEHELGADFKIFDD